MKASLFLGLILALYMSLPAPAEAASMRCGIHLVQGGGRHGPTKYEVLKKCGEPQQRRASTWIYRIRNTTWELRFSSSGILNTVQQQR